MVVRSIVPAEQRHPAVLSFGPNSSSMQLMQQSCERQRENVMKLSIVIICWNDWKVIENCLRSIFEEHAQDSNTK